MGYLNIFLELGDRNHPRGGWGREKALGTRMDRNLTTKNRKFKCPGGRGGDVEVSRYSI